MVFQQPSKEMAKYMSAKKQFTAEEAKEIGVERNIKKLEKIVSITSNEIPIYSKTKVTSALKTKQIISLKLGPNNVHDILDSLEQNH